MDQHTNSHLEQADEDILTYTVSDEALEFAAGTEGGGQVIYHGVGSAAPAPLLNFVRWFPGSSELACASVAVPASVME